MRYKGDHSPSAFVVRPGKGGYYSIKVFLRVERSEVVYNSAEDDEIERIDPLGDGGEIIRRMGS